jgi:hypothetical protein
MQLNTTPPGKMPVPPLPPPTLTAAAAAAAAAADASGDGGGGEADDANDADDTEADDSRGMAKGQEHPPGRLSQRRGGPGEGGGRRRSEPFVCCPFPWRNRQGGTAGARNKTLLIAYTRVRIE